MNLLAIETSTELASIALLAGEQLLCAEQSNPKTHAQFILPMIESLMQQADMRMPALDAIVFGRGPGSFTGLRIACSMAKGLAYGHDLGLIPVSTLSTIAFSVRQQKKTPVLAVLDARMHELYWAFFNEDEWTAEEHVSVASNLGIPEKLTAVLAGTGIDLYEEAISEVVKAQISEKLTVYPSASAMIQLVQFAGLKPVAASEAEVVYVRNKVTWEKSNG